MPMFAFSLIKLSKVCFSDPIPTATVFLQVSSQFALISARLYLGTSYLADFLLF